MVYFSLSNLDHFARPQKCVGRFNFDETAVLRDSFSARRRATFDPSATRGHRVIRFGRLRSQVR